MEDNAKEWRRPRLQLPKEVYIPRFEKKNILTPLK
jgi:hypothetical protein